MSVPINVAISTTDQVMLPTDNIDQRRQSMQMFLQAGLPTTKSEAWRYTDISQLSKTKWSAAQPAKLASIQARKVKSIHDRHPLVWINGRFQSDMCAPIDGVEMSTVAIGSEPDHESALLLLNHALAPESTHLKITQTISTPLHLFLIDQGTPDATTSHTKLNIALESDCHAQLVIHSTTDDKHMTLSNRVLQLVLADNSQLNVINRVNHSHTTLTTTHAMIASNGRLNWHDIKTESQLHRDEISIELIGNHSAFSFNGLTRADGDSLHDNTLRVHHHGLDTSSEQSHIGIANGTSRIVFNSEAKVAPGASGADSKQSSRNLALSPSAIINAKPSLVINNDDVRCAHGATTGQLDEQAMFYLRSRGLDQQQAHTILLSAFVEPFFKRLEKTLQGRYKNILNAVDFARIYTVPTN
ncbi:MAG: hypothetical protein HKM24_07685 [Gammaproteobacteria bacterium]|nr:hypothetical protein [Gammaproteobacteria bacterium]